MFPKLYLSKICMMICCLLLTHSAQTQVSLHPNGLTYKFLVTDYNTLDSIFQNANDPDRIFHPDDVNYAGEIGYFRHINKSLSLGAPLRLGSVDSHHSVFDSLDVNCQPCQVRKRNDFFFGGDLIAVYKFNNDYMLKEDFILAPYIFLGVGALYFSQRTGHFDFQIPMGLGLNLKLTKLLYLQAQFEYRKSLVIQKDNMAISFGIVWLVN